MASTRALKTCDLIVLDPPRTGAGREVMERICALTPRAVAYVACDPASFARDIASRAIWVGTSHRYEHSTSSP